MSDFLIKGLAIRDIIESNKGNILTVILIILFLLVLREVFYLCMKSLFNSSYFKLKGKGVLVKLNIFSKDNKFLILSPTEECKTSGSVTMHDYDYGNSSTISTGSLSGSTRKVVKYDYSKIYIGKFIVCIKNPIYCMEVIERLQNEGVIFENDLDKSFKNDVIQSIPKNVLSELQQNHIRCSNRVLVFIMWVIIFFLMISMFSKLLLPSKSIVEYKVDEVEYLLDEDTLSETRETLGEDYYKEQVARNYITGVDLVDDKGNKLSVLQDTANQDFEGVKEGSKIKLVKVNQLFFVNDYYLYNGNDLGEAKKLSVIDNNLVKGIIN